MWMPDPQAVSREDFHIQRVWQGCEEKELRRQPEEEEEELQAKATSGCISEVNSNLESHIKFLKGGGQPLSENDRTFFEPRLQPGAGCECTGLHRGAGCGVWGRAVCAGDERGVKADGA